MSRQRNQRRASGRRSTKRLAPRTPLCLELLEARDLPSRNVVVFVADGLRAGSVNPTDAPTMFDIITAGGALNGVNFSNSHSVFPTFTTPNAAAIATGHYPGDTGDFSNTIFTGYPLFNTGSFTGRTPGTPTPFIEDDQTLGDIDTHFGGNFLDEESLLAFADRKSTRLNSSH